jgi:hypothetical protein
MRISQGILIIWGVNFFVYFSRLAGDTCQKFDNRSQVSVFQIEFINGRLGQLSMRNMERNPPNFKFKSFIGFLQNFCFIDFFLITDNK